MKEDSLDKHFTRAVLANLILKSRIMAIIFGVIFIMQVIMITWLVSTDAAIYIRINGSLMIAGPMLILAGGLMELYFARYFNHKLKNDVSLNQGKIFLISLVDVSFPSIVLWFAINVLNQIQLVNMGQILSSPPLLMYFILISLSSFALNHKINYVSGIIAAAEYVIIVLVYAPGHVNEYEIKFILIRSVLLIIAGIVTGSFTKRFMEAVSSSIKSKDDLINTLDAKVNERTKELNEKNKEILDSITYAKGLQQAILPSEEKLQSTFEEIFILYKPKDIVAGDFYWMEERDGKIWFAVCDCTGHGVPGAMVSLVCSNALTQALIECESDKASEILDLVKQKVISTFSRQGRSVKDGMDAVLCCFDLKSKKLNYAAANNSLYLLRDNNLEDYGADKIPVGKSENSESYTYREISLHSGDFIYLTTDGFPDQFGGPLSVSGGKKFKYKPLKQLLLKNHKLSAEHQKKELEMSFDYWKGNLEQVDDVCIAGISIK